MKFLVGTAEGGPFTKLAATDEKIARSYVEHYYGKVLDIVEWPDEDGVIVPMFIVR